MKALECHDLCVGYDGHPVLSGVSFDVAPGEVVALLGPNGGGKTTLLKTLSGLLPKISGSIAIAGSSIGDLGVKEIAQKIAFVPQEEAWHFAFTVEQIVAMGRLSRSTSYFESQEDIERAHEAMHEAGCFDLRSRTVTELSGGERQRALLARALAQETPLLFLDEPTAHLDPKYQQSVVRTVLSLARRGKAILTAIHDLQLASALADRAVIVGQGQVGRIEEAQQLLASGALEEIYGAQFDRITLGDGRIAVFPRLP